MPPATSRDTEQWLTVLVGRWRFVYSSDRGEEEMQTQLGSASQAAAAEAFCDVANTIDRFKGTYVYVATATCWSERT